MALKYKVAKTFKSPVDVVLPDGSKGQFTAEFLYMNREEFEDMAGRNLTDSQVLDVILKGVMDIKDEDTGDFYPAEVQLNIVKTDIAMGAAAVRTFMDRLSGEQKGNLRRSLAR